MEDDKILCFLLQGGIIEPLETPELLVGKPDEMALRGVYATREEGCFIGKHAQSGDQFLILWDKVLSVNLTPRGGLQNRVLMPQGGRIQ